MAERPDETVSFVRRRRDLLTLVVLLLVALALRVYQVDWDQGHLYHPDERYILMTTAGLSLAWPPNVAQLLSPQSTLDPHGFAYGSFSFYLLRLIAALLIGLSNLLPSLHFLDQLTDLANLRLIGRPISALFDTATVFVVYQIGRRLYGRKTALLAAILVTFSVLDIQLSHFYATDTIMTCFVVSAILASVAYMQDGRLSPAIWAGVFTGLALATKVSAAPVLAPVGMAYVLRAFAVDTRDRGIQVRLPSSRKLGEALETLVLSLCIGAMVFIIVEPYAIIDFKAFVSGFSEQGSMVRGIVDLPYTRQFIGRPPYLYFLQILILFGVGLPLGLAMLAGTIFVIARTVYRPRKRDLLLLSFVVPYFAITGSFYAKFMRYLLPITPILILFAAAGMIQLLGLVTSWRRLPDSHPQEVDEGNLPTEPEAESDWDALPEITDEAYDSDVFDLERFDGPPIADDEPPRWEPSPSIASSAGVLVVAAEANVVGADALRFAQLKGLSLEWFSPAAIASQDGVFDEIAEDPLQFGKEEEAPDADECPPPEDTVLPMPSWISRHPRLAGFFAGSASTVVARTLVGVVVSFSVFYSLAYDHMYASTSTPVEGSAWLYQHALPGSTIATEHWEEGMPVPIVTETGVISADSQHYRNLTMPMYDDDTAAKLDTLVNNLESADYVVFFSNRLYGTVPRLPGRYPMSRRYYEQLFGEKLGFKLVAAFDRYPNLLGVAFVDDTLSDPGLPTPPLLRQQSPAPITIGLGHADESFSVYDHQKVLIFQKVEKLSPDQLRGLIGPPPAQIDRNSGGLPDQYKSLVFTPAQEGLVQSGGTFHDLFDRTDVYNQFPLLTWIVLIVLVSLAGLPLGFLAFRFLPDRGYLASRTLAVLVLVWLNWIVVSLGVVEVTRTSTLVILGIVLALGVAAAIVQRHELLAFVSSHRRLLAIEEGVFWVAFLYDVWIRSLDPDLWHPVLGGEKPMDLAYFTAAAKSPIYPPYDPWFAGGYLNYYYFGQIVVGTLTRISGVLPTTAYNVVVPFLFALTVAGAFTAALALVHRGRGVPDRSAVLGGLLAAAMVCVLGNLGGFIQFVQQVSQQAPGSASAIPVFGGLIQFLNGLVGVSLGGKPLIVNQDWYWSSTRALALLGLKGTGSINEFPYFTFLFADLHAHLIGLPFTLLAIAFCVNVVKSRGVLSHSALVRSSSGSASVPRRAVDRSISDDDGVIRGVDRSEDVGKESVASTVAAIGFAALTIGALFPTNSWDYPTYVGLIGVSLAIPWFLSRRLSRGGFATLVARFAIIVVAGRVLYLPFYANFQSFYSGVHPNDEKSEISWFFVINGLFLVVMVAYLLVQGWAFYRRTGLIRALRLYVGKWDLLPRTLELQRVFIKRWDPREVATLYVVGWLAILVAGAVLFGMPLTGVLVALLVVVLALGVRRDLAPEDCLVMLLFATGLALAIGTEQLTIDGDIGRMNTVFKFYEQIWVLWGVASAVALVRTAERLRELGSATLRRVWLTVVVAFFVMASVYPIIGTIARVSNRFSVDLPPTLDGTAYMDRAVYVDDGKPLHLVSDKEAIIWLQDHVVGTPTILEGNRPLYRWGSRISIYTGLPTVIGWDWHQKQQRWGYQYLVDERLKDVERMYDDPSPALTVSLLHTYHVSYVVDGELEQAFYPGARAKFDSMIGKDLSVVYDRDGVRIYQVK